MAVASTIHRHLQLVGEIGGGGGGVGDAVGELVDAVGKGVDVAGDGGGGANGSPARRAGEERLARPRRFVLGGVGGRRGVSFHKGDVRQGAAVCGLLPHGVVISARNHSPAVFFTPFSNHGPSSEVTKYESFRASCVGASRSMFSMHDRSHAVSQPGHARALQPAQVSTQLPSSIPRHFQQTGIASE